MKILNWNTNSANPKSKNERFEKVCALLDRFDADVICLTEAHPATMSSAEATISSRPAGRGWEAEGGRRKVMLWSRYGWQKVDDEGSPKMPKGRFISAKTCVNGLEWTFVGMCIPWRDYPRVAKKAERTMGLWEAACTYLDALRSDVMPHISGRPRTILLGDYNLQIPPFDYPYPDSRESDRLVNQKRKLTFDGWLIPTSGIRQRFIDHIAMSTDLRVESIRFISKFGPDAKELSDHNGVCIEAMPA